MIPVQQIALQLGRRVEALQEVVRLAGRAHAALTLLVRGDWPDETSRMVGERIAYAMLEAFETHVDENRYFLSGQLKSHAYRFRLVLREAVQHFELAVAFGEHAPGGCLSRRIAVELVEDRALHLSRLMSCLMETCLKPGSLELLEMR